MIVSVNKIDRIFQSISLVGSNNLPGCVIPRSENLFNADIFRKKSIANVANIGYLIFFMLIDKWGMLVSFVAI